MKVLVFLLVLANLLFYAFGAGYFGRPDNPDAGRAGQQILPERMRIVSRGEAPAAPVNATPSLPSVTEPAAADIAKEPARETSSEEVAVKPAEHPPVCLAWEHLSAADADRLAAVLTGKFANFKVSRRVIAAEGNGWWVHVPPLASKAEADKKAGELKQLEISDFFVVQDGPSRFAISLGVFSSEKGAQDRLADLKAKGVRSAKVGPRPGKDSTVRLQAHGPSTDRDGLLAAVGKIVPKAEAQDCK
ncbi:MAG: SPOR domain-containing protein [Azonexus sp.]|nr:SPOR domain-containing protein [Azonexus sp.]